MKKIFILSILAIGLMGCHSQKKVAETQTAAPEPKQEVQKPAAVGVPSPPTFIYKTKKDYSQYVPVGYASKHITSYPDPRDVKVGDKLMTPTALADGYWLDNRGISTETAFLSYTYEEYAALPSVPNDLYQKLLDTDPITEMWDCGPRHTWENPEKDINKLIKTNQLESRCRRIK
ncbi:MAG: hypothetical protein MJZ49_03220 [Bacteroidales bacterium]|nr:hypothetical protein [Bacteroidales bacterium]